MGIDCLEEPGRGGRHRAPAAARGPAALKAMTHGHGRKFLSWLLYLEV